MAVTHSPERMLEAPAGKTMVKILEIDGQLDAEEDDDCCEIDLAEFAKKATLKAADDDVVVVAAKGPIKVRGIRKIKIKVKVEADQLGDCSVTNGDRRERAAGDCLENPYEIEEDGTAIHPTESAQAKRDIKSEIKSPVKCESQSFEQVAADLSPVKCEPDEGKLFKQVIKMSPVTCESEGFEEVIPDTLKLKSQHEDGSGADEHFVEVIPDISLLKFGSVCFEEFIPPVKSTPEDGNGAAEHLEKVVPNMSLLNCESKCFVEVIAVMSPVKCEPEEGNSADELFEQAIPDMSSVKCGSESFVEVVAGMSVTKSKHDDGISADEHPEEVIPDMSLLKHESEWFEEDIPDMSPVKLGPQDSNGAGKCVEQEEDAYDHLPEMDIEGRVFEEDNDDFVLVGREAL